MSEASNLHHRAFVVEDKLLHRQGLINMLRERGYGVIAECSDYASALEYLKRDNDFALVMADKHIPEERGGRPQEGVGPNLLYAIKKSYPHLGPLVLYTTLAAPNIGDIQRVYQIGASALAIPHDYTQELFAKELELVLLGAQVLSPLFRELAAGAADPKNQCPLDPVEYYCARLICEHRGKEGAAAKWESVSSVYVIDEILDDIYDKLSSVIKDFADAQKEKKQQLLAKWYHDYAAPLYGTAAPVIYEPRKVRRKKWTKIFFDPDAMISL